MGLLFCFVFFCFQMTTIIQSKGVFQNMKKKRQDHCIYTWLACWNLPASDTCLYKAAGQSQALSQIPVWLLPNHQSTAKAVELDELDLVPPVDTPCFLAVLVRQLRREGRKITTFYMVWLFTCFFVFFLYFCSTSCIRCPADHHSNASAGFFFLNVGEASPPPSPWEAVSIFAAN